MNKTRIEWCDYTWNPVTGCLGPKGDGKRCSYCYAHRLAKGRLRKLYLELPWVLAGKTDDPFAPRWWLDRLEQPIRAKIGPSRIFVVDMGDLFGDWVPRSIQEQVLDVAHDCRQHTFMFLTKWPQNLAQFNPWPDNCWVGATATTGTEVFEASMHLGHVLASVRYLSIEPLLAHVPISNIGGDINWLIAGAQTGPGAKPVDRQDVHELIDAADRRGIPIFLKDNLHWPEPRQEWPR